MKISQLVESLNKLKEIEGDRCVRIKGGKIIIEDTSSAVQLYNAYPRHVGRGVAIPAINSALTKEKFDVLMEATKAYAVATSKWTIEDQRRFIPHPSTWFNQERYKDDRSTWIRSSGSGPHQNRGQVTDNDMGEVPF